MIQRLQITMIAMLISVVAFGQIGIGTTSPDASSALDITATNKGFLMPRLTTAQRTAITSPATGLQVFDTDTNSFWYYNGATWTEGNGVGKFIDGVSADIAYYDGRVGIGVNNFSQAHKLYLKSDKTGNDEDHTAVRIDANYSGTQTSTTTYGMVTNAINSSSGTVSFAIGTQGIVNNQNTGGTISSGIGSYPQVNNSGTIGFGGGVFTVVNNYGTMNQAEGFGAYLYNDSGKSITDMFLEYLAVSNLGTITNGYGLYLEYLGTGTITNSYALYIKDNFNKGTNDNFAIYSASNANSYVEGNLGVGTSNPQQKVHINGVMRLEPQATAPTGALGDLYVNTNGNLYFHDGTGWKQVQIL